MKRGQILVWLLVLLLGGIPLAEAAPGAAEQVQQLVQQMREAQRSTGFAVRLQISEQGNEQNGSPHSEPVKLAIIGQSTAAGRRLLLRGIAPAAVRDQQRLAEVSAAPAGCTRASDARGKVDPLAPLFGTPLPAWDLLTPWWYWPRQTLVGKDQVAGKECTLIRSRNDAANSAVREVLSCVDGDAGLSWRTQWFDAQGGLLRSLTVVTTLRHENGLLSPRRAVLSVGRRNFDIEAYSGDEHYRVVAATFAPLDGASPCVP